MVVRRRIGSKLNAARLGLWQRFASSWCFIGNLKRPGVSPAASIGLFRPGRQAMVRGFRCVTGLGRPMAGHPPKIHLSAEHEIIVILVDERMARRARASDQPIADKWGHLVGDLLGSHGPAGAS